MGCPSSFVPTAITQPFFELQTPDFAWKFVWIVQINYKSTKSTKKVHKYKSTHNSVIFRATDSRFYMKFMCTVQPTEKVQKYKKYKSTKYRNRKIHKYKKAKK